MSSDGQGGKFFDRMRAKFSRRNQRKEITRGNEPQAMNISERLPAADFTVLQNHMDGKNGRGKLARIMNRKKIRYPYSKDGKWQGWAITLALHNA